MDPSCIVNTDSISTVEMRDANDESKEKQASIANCDSVEQPLEKISDKITMSYNELDREHETINVNRSETDVDSLTVTSNKCIRKRLAIIDSDSDDDSSITNKNVEVVIEAAHSENEECDIKLIKDNKTRRKRLTIVDSDSDESTFDHNVKISTKEDSDSTLQKKRTTFIHSDSEDKIDTYTSSNVHIATHTNFVSEDASNDSDSESYKAVVSRVAALCDEDSDDDADASIPTCLEKFEICSSVIKSKSASKKKASHEVTQKPSQTKLTPKQAIQQRQEIRSASQKRVRETSASLPYHKPKSHSIKEFLQNRPRLSTSLVKDTTNVLPALALKMTTEQLKEISKKLEEREKVVQQFYMSDNESDEDSLPDNSSSLMSPKNCDQDILSQDSNNELKITVQEEVKKAPDGSVLGNETGDEQNDSINVNAEICLKIQNETVNECNEHSTATEILVEDPQNTETLHTSNTCNSAKTLLNDALTNKISTVDNSTYDEDTDEFNKIIEKEISLMEFDLTSKNNGPESFCTTPSIDNCDSSSVHQQTDNMESSNRWDSLCEKDSTSTKTDSYKESEDFEFNLDDLEITSPSKLETMTEDEEQKMVKKYTSLDNNNQSQVLSKLELLKQKVGDFKPCLSGNPDEDIDLERGITKPNDVSLLVRRFMKHNVNINKTKQKVLLDVINLSQGEMRHETVAMSVDPEEAPVNIMEKPGEKIRKLRQDLQTRIAQRRSELWQQKLELVKDNNVTTGDTKDEEEKSNYEADVEDDILDDEEEVELTDEDDVDDLDNDGDDEENDIEEKGSSLPFIDGEAEETDEDNDDGSNAETTEQNDFDTVEQETLHIKKPLRRILKGFTEDSDDDELVVAPMPPLLSKDSNLIKTNTYDEDEPITPNQPRVEKTPQKSPQPTPNNSCFTPIIQSAGFQNLNSGSKFLQESPASPTPMQESSQHIGLQRKLFSNTSDLDTQSTFNKLVQLCSGSFSNSVREVAKDHIPDTQDLLDLCSGSFPTTSGNKESDVTLNPTIFVPQSTNTEIKTLTEDKLISELLDEEEMELFKKKFESPIAAQSSIISNEQNDSNEDIQEVQGGGVIFSDSSDDDNTELKNNATKKLKKKLAFSDDESIDEEDECDDIEEITLHDNEIDEEVDESHIDYDSEENEIELEPSNNIKLGDFLENEAELSESDWDSADEDEQGLDVLETEKGDADVFDEDKLKNDLEKIHMRRVLDQDNQEIKILQELLLEDGELNGTGRQRQFRWSNINDTDDLPLNNIDLDVCFDEEECEEQWRKSRHQREMFLKKKQEKFSNIDEDDLLSSDSNSQIFKLGQEAVRKSLSKSILVPDNTKCQTSPESKKPSLIMNTRGSFLARNDKFLTRLADFTKVTTETVVKTTKNSKGFIFQKLDLDDKDLNVKKRKASEKTPSIIKKLRLTKEDTSPMSVNSKKKLF